MLQGLGTEPVPWGDLLRRCLQPTSSSSYKRITTLIIRSSRGGTYIVHTRPRTTGTRAGGVTYTPSLFAAVKLHSA